MTELRAEVLSAEPQEFQKKPVRVIAWHWTGGNGPIPDFIPKDRYFWNPLKQEIFIQTEEGVMKASAGDWIIRGIKGEFYPCQPDIFEVTYEAASYRSTAVAPERPNCDYTGRPSLDPSQICRCGTCQLFVRILFSERRATAPVLLAETADER